MSQRRKKSRKEIGLAAFAMFSEDRALSQESVLETDRRLPRGSLIPDEQYRRDLEALAILPVLPTARLARRLRAEGPRTLD